MYTYDITVVIHQARKMDDKTKFGPDCLNQFGTTAGVSGLSTRPEGPTLADQLPDGQDVDYAIKDRKAVKIELLDGMKSGEYKIGNITLGGLRSTAHKASDGMGSTMYCYTREARLLGSGEGHNTAIDQAIRSGVILLVPGTDGKRRGVEARILAVFGLYGNRAPDN